MLTSFNRSFKLLLILVMCIGCSKKDEHRNSTAPNIGIKNIGHAGSGFNYLFMPFNPYPTNSFQSLKNALADGADGVEVDVQLTADQQLVLYHDNTLESKTNLSGYIINANSKDVIGADYMCGFPYDLFHSEHIITFQQWIDYAISLPQVPYLQIDLKTGNGQSDSMVNNLLKLTIDHLKGVDYPLEKVILISGEDVVITKLLNNYPQINCAYEPAEFAPGLEWIVANKCKFIIMDQKYVTAKDVQSAHDKGIGVITLGGRAKSTFTKLIEMKPDYIQSNNVNLLHKLLQ